MLGFPPLKTEHIQIYLKTLYENDSLYFLNKIINIIGKNHYNELYELIDQGDFKKIINFLKPLIDLEIKKRFTIANRIVYDLSKKNNYTCTKIKVNVYLLKNTKNSRFYYINLEKETCTCPDFLYRTKFLNLWCCHLYAINSVKEFIEEKKGIIY